MTAHRCPRCRALVTGRCSCVKRPSPTARGYGYRWQQVRAEHLRMEPTCRICGEAATDVDHIVSRWYSGSDDHDNLRSLCHSHHSRKTARVDGGFGNVRRLHKRTA